MTHAITLRHAAPSVPAPRRSRRQRAGAYNAGVTLEALADEGLVAEVSRGSEEALRQLYRRHATAVFSLARRMLRDEEAAEEVVQDVFLKLWQRAGDYAAARGGLSSWLLTIAHHATVDAIRRRSLRQTVPVEERELEAAPDARDVAGTAIDRAGIDRALATLEPADRRLVETAYYEGLSHSQIAKATGMPLGTVKTRIRLALLRLRKELVEW